MDNSIIGAQITKFRKAANLTQEELGRSVGVSTQAVSRWECGGTPDISLLPAIADKLGVDINALFGREGGEALDIQQALIQWMSTVPKENMIDALNRLVWSAVSKFMNREFHVDNFPYLQTCEAAFGAADKSLMCSVINSNGGTFFGIGAEDMAFSTICPRPEAGYAAYFSDNDSYRSLFELLAAPGCLELIEYMLGREEKLFSVDALAEGLRADAAAVEELLVRLEQQNLADSMEVVLPAGLTRIYEIKDDGSFVPFLYLARCFMDASRNYYLNWNSRTKPLL